QGIQRIGGLPWVVMGQQKRRIEIEDTLYFIRNFSSLPNGRVQLSLNDGSKEDLILSSLNYSSGRLTCRVKNGKEEAKFQRGPYHELLSLAEETSKGIKITIQGQTVTLLKA